MKFIFAFILGMILLWFSSVHAASYLMADIAYTEPVDDALASTTLHMKIEGLRKRSYVSPATSSTGNGLVTKTVRIPLTAGSANISFWATAKDQAGNISEPGEAMKMNVKVGAE